MADTYIKISELPEKTDIVSTDYMVVEDLKDTYKVQASHFTDQLREQIESASGNLDKFIEDANATLEDINKAHDDVQNAIKDIEEEQDLIQQSEELRRQEFEEMKQVFEDIDVDKLEEMQEYISQIESNEAQRQQNELQRQQNESTRLENSEKLLDLLEVAEDLSNTLDQNEVIRQQNENQRIQNENERITNFSDIQSFCDDVATAENERVQAEENRNTLVTDAVNNMNSLITSVTESESEREQAESERENFYDSAQEFIIQAESSENQRISNEQTRQEEFEDMKSFIESFEANSSYTLDTACSKQLTTGSTMVSLCDIYLNDPENTDFSIDRFGMIYEIDEYNASHMMVNRCIVYMSCSIGTTFGSISMKMTESSTCSDTSVWICPSADYKTLFIGYTGSVGNFVELKLISNSSSNSSNYNEINCSINNAADPISTYPSNIAPVNCLNSPADTKPYGYELELFNVFNGTLPISSSTYPVGFELTTTSSINPSAQLGGTWEPVLDGCIRIDMHVYDDNGSATSMQTHTVYKWVKVS